MGPGPVPKRAIFLIFACALASAWVHGCSAPQSADRGVSVDADGVADPVPPVPPGGTQGTDAGAPAGREPTIVCGNGRLDPGEDCDLGALNQPNAYGEGLCSTTCRKAGACGDGVRNGPEECDDGSKNVESDGTYGLPGQCNHLCRKITQYCGDAMLTEPEKCDLGPDNSDMAYGPNLCTKSCLPAPFCGDARPDGREECDDGPANLLTDKTWTLQGVGCNQGCKKIVHRCGDGKMDAPDEQCDAGMMNTNSDATYGTQAGCNRVCKKIGFCGDGFRDPLENCDQGTNNTKDDTAWALKMGGCNRRCQVANLFCGDGHVFPEKEQCDLGPGRNTGGPGGCDARCRLVPP